MDFLKSIAVAASGLRAQAGRMRVLAENIANADSTAQGSDSDPYRRKIPTFTSEIDRTLDARVVSLGRVHADKSDFLKKHRRAGAIAYTEVAAVPVLQRTAARCAAPGTHAGE